MVRSSVSLGFHKDQGFMSGITKDGVALRDGEISYLERA